jgi:spore coat polysaccharide biosynthesis predicted glycosyltransferase SpsG
VLGAMYKQKDELVKLAGSSEIKTEIYQNTPEMPHLLAESDIVFNSGGLTVWEAGVFNNLVVIMGYSERERIGGEFIGKNKYGIYLGTKDDYDLSSLSEKIDAILNSDNSQFIINLSKKIDVNGITKVVKAISSL